MTEKDRNEEIFTIKESGNFVSNQDDYLWERKQKNDTLNNIYELLEKIKIDRDGSQKKINNLNLQVQALQRKINEMICERTVMTNALMASRSSNVEEILTNVIEMPIKQIRYRKLISEHSNDILMKQLQHANDGWEDALRRLEIMENERILTNNKIKFYESSFDQNIVSNLNLEKLRTDFENIKQHVLDREKEVRESDCMKNQQIKQLKNKIKTLLEELHSVTNNEYKLETDPESIFSDEPVYLCIRKNPDEEDSE